ncbi:chloride channel protein [Marinomonas sp. A79]|uniref:Chloride channel protein n=1 Tax=Marinomonas vulgaris TaxID=2823372 RepID=A0ABS5HAB4_9GAMM|nr:chloride channel protein [Marinomonas vulgaris]MBR7888612.1 chloride channel protein [Marinomonas vulgaris]
MHFCHWSHDLKGLNFKERWASKAKTYDDLLILAVLGTVCGLFSGLLMAVFYAVVYLPARYLLGTDFDAFEMLPVEWRVGLLVGACFVLALVFTLLPKPLHKVGVPFVVERLNHHNGNLPVWNAVVQFFTAAIGLVGGLSIGKEGPAVHLGATLGSVLAQKAKLPRYGVETLLACGVAGAISAVFQTPLAGVLFVFEVIFLEYQQRYVLPVLLSSVTATLVSHNIIGPLDIISIDAVSSLVLSLDLFVACSALVVFILVLSVVFLQAQKQLWRFSGLSVWWRFALVALASCVAAVYLPESLGSGFLPLSHLLSGDLIVYSLFLLIVVKTVLTAFTIGMGIPGGMIGPTFIIGGLAGVQVGLVFGEGMTDVTLFALLGMAAMMATCFQAPLTALIAIIEMTHSSATIVPALFVIVLSCLLIRVFFHQESVFVERLHFMGMMTNMSPFQRFLKHHTIKPVAESVLVLPTFTPIERVKDLASNMIDYVVYEKDSQWRLVRRLAVLDALQTLDAGPQPWLIVLEEGVAMDVSRAADSTPVSVIEEPASLEDMLSWFQKTGLSEVIVPLPNSSFRLVSRHRLDQFLLKSD